MSNKEIDGVNVLLKAVANVDEIIGINKSEVAFDHKPTVHVREEFFLEQFNAYARRPFTEDYDCLFTEIDGVVWHCLVGRCKPCSPTEQN